MKAVVVFVGFLLVASFVAGVLLTESYWANPPREEALAERIRIENRDLEERQQIDLEAYRRKKQDEAIVRREKAHRALMWGDRWHELGMGLVSVFVVGLLVIIAIRVGVPALARSYEAYAHACAQLVGQKAKLEEIRAGREAREAERLREESRLQEILLGSERVRAILPSPSGIPGNGRHSFRGSLDDMNASKPKPSPDQSHEGDDRCSATQPVSEVPGFLRARLQPSGS